MQNKEKNVSKDDLDKEIRSAIEYVGTVRGRLGEANYKLVR